MIYKKFQEEVRYIEDMKKSIQFKKIDDFFKKSSNEINFRKNNKNGSFIMNYNENVFVYNHNNMDKTSYNVMLYCKNKLNISGFYSPIFVDNKKNFLSNINEILQLIINKNYYFYLLTRENEHYNYFNHFKLNLLESDKSILKKDIEYISNKIKLNDFQINDANLFYLSFSHKDTNFQISFKNSFVKNSVYNFLKINKYKSIFGDYVYNTELSVESNLNLILSKYIGKTIEKYRKITEVEAELLQMFPPNWTSTGMSKSRRYFMMGNALVTGVINKMEPKLKKIILNEIDN